MKKEPSWAHIKNQSINGLSSGNTNKNAMFVELHIQNYNHIPAELQLLGAKLKFSNVDLKMTTKTAHTGITISATPDHHSQNCPTAKSQNKSSLNSVHFT
jgi:hypothetical protein